jgi:hypothetical protein
MSATIYRELSQTFKVSLADDAQSVPVPFHESFIHE